MTNRQKIVKAANDAGIKIKKLWFERSREALYGDTWDNSHWILESESGECYCSDKGDNLVEGIDIMIEEMIEDSDTQNRGLSRKDQND